MDKMLGVNAPSGLRRCPRPIKGGGLWALVMVFALVIPVGCASTENKEPGRIVGKSSYTRPPWIDKSMSVSKERRLGYFSYVKRNVSVLELGIKQAQAEATSQAVSRFVQAFADYAVELVKANDGEPPGGESEGAWLAALRTQAVEAAGRFELPSVKPETVYWEEVELVAPGPSGIDELRREYRIYILVSFPMSEITDRMTGLGASLAAAPKGRFSSALAAIDREFPGIRAVSEESAADKKDVESIQTEMDSAGADVESSQDRQGPRGRRIVPKGSGGRKVDKPKK